MFLIRSLLWEQEVARRGGPSLPINFVLFYVDRKFSFLSILMGFS